MARLTDTKLLEDELVDIIVGEIRNLVIDYSISDRCIEEMEEAKIELDEDIEEKVIENVIHRIRI